MSRFRTGTGVGIAMVAAGVAVVACGSSMGASFDSSGGSGTTADGGGADDRVGAPAAGGVGALDNGLILVHAASGGAFRLCFENELDRLPQPDSKVMPEANVVGVEVGTAVRIDPLRGAPGHVYLYDESFIRGLYTPSGSGTTVGPTCAKLRQSATPPPSLDLGDITADLSRGVHLLAVTGCPAGAGTAAKCGGDYDAGGGNMKAVHVALPGYTRSGPSVLPMQVMHLAQPLEGTRAGRAMSILFHDGKPAAKDTVITQNPAILAAPTPAFPAQLPFDGADAAVYDSYSVRVELAAGAGDGGTTRVLEQTLASIQALSSPRDVPTTYYAKASNFVLLMLGDPALVQADGGGDPYRALHLLAIPVIEPKPDGGADGGDGGP